MALEIVYYAATSLDGFIATPDGGVEWLDQFMTPGEDYGYSEFLKSIDVILMGSRTYEKSLTFGEWPYTGKPYWVFTKRTLKAASKEIFFTSLEPRAAIEELLSRKFKKAWLMGGGQLAASLRAEGLITEYDISVVPLTLGHGIPLFGSPGLAENLKLIESKPLSNGIVQLHYSRF